MGNTLPPLRLGQVWQTRDQRVGPVKIMRLSDDGKTAYISFKNDVGDGNIMTWGEALLIGHSTTEKDGAYPIHYPEKGYDLTSILYDPL